MGIDEGAGDEVGCVGILTVVGALVNVLKRIESGSCGHRFI